MQLKLKKLVMENFAGFKNQTFEFNGQDADILAKTVQVKQQQLLRYNGCYLIKDWMDQQNHLILCLKMKMEKNYMN